MLDLGIGDGVAADVLLAMPNQRLHAKPPEPAWGHDRPSPPALLSVLTAPSGDGSWPRKGLRTRAHRNVILHGVLVELTGVLEVPAAARIGADAMQDERSRFALLLGRTVVALWGQLPRDIQELVFESAA